MLQVAICEDEQRYLDYISGAVEKILTKNNLIGQIVCKAANPETIEDYIKHKEVNVFLLDIDLKVPESGYSLAQKIRELDRRAYIVFISAHLEFVLQAFKVKPFDFLPKPVTMEILEKCILDIYSDHMSLNTEKESSHRIEIKSGANIYRIKTVDIIFIEKLNFKTIIHMVNNEINCYETLESIEKRLPSDIFVRCHKSFIANREYISTINIKEKKIVFESGQCCFIGDKYKKGLMPGV